MADNPDYILELNGHVISDKQKNDLQDNFNSRPYISVYFECCSVYNRIYKNKQGTAYVGWCPKCTKKVQVKVGSGGVNCRIFTAK
jgi:hypothetical protein